MRKRFDGVRVFSNHFPFQTEKNFGFYDNFNPFRITSISKTVPNFCEHYSSHQDNTYTVCLEGWINRYTLEFGSDFILKVHVF